MDEHRHGLSADILQEISGFLQHEGPGPGAPILSQFTSSDEGDPTQCLPPEILAECFAFMSLRDLISASHVSSHWRSTAVAFPALWAIIPLVWLSGSPDEILYLALSRGGQLPVDFEFSSLSDQSLPRNMVTVVGQNMHRFRTFRWRWDIHEVDLTIRAPLLEEFDYRETFCPIPTDFLGGTAGRLRTLYLGDTRFPDACPALSTVTRLRASYPWYIEQPLGFERIFALCPQLEALNLRTIFAHTRIGLPAGPFPPNLRDLKLHALVDCNLVQMFHAWAQGVYPPRVKLKMPLTPVYNVAPFLEGALDIAVTFERDHKSRIVANLPNARQHTLSFYELEQVFEPAAVLGKIFRDMTPATLAQVRSLRVPLSVLNHIVAARLHWPAVTCLEVDMSAHDAYDITPYEFGETYRRFRWSTLACLRALRQRFPGVTALSLTLCRNDAAERPTLQDAHELLKYVSTQSQSGRALPIAHVHGFPADVVRAVAAEAPAHPWVPFSL